MQALLPLCCSVLSICRSTQKCQKINACRYIRFWSSKHTNIIISASICLAQCTKQFVRACLAGQVDPEIPLWSPIRSPIRPHQARDKICSPVMTPSVCGQQSRAPQRADATTAAWAPAGQADNHSMLTQSQTQQGGLGTIDCMLWASRGLATSQVFPEDPCNMQHVHTSTGRLTVVLLLCGALFGTHDEAPPHGEVDRSHTNHSHNAHDTTQPLHGCRGRDVCRQGALGFSNIKGWATQKPCTLPVAVGLYRQGNRQHWHPQGEGQQVTQVAAALR